MKKRILSFLLLTVMLFSLIAMTACDDEPETPPPAPTGPTLAATMLEKGYTTFVYPLDEEGDENITAAYTIVNNAFKGLTGVDLTIKSDGGSWSSNAPNNQKEILLGNTNRTASHALSETVLDNRKNSAKDYQIKMGNQEILLATGDDVYTTGDTMGYVTAATAFAAMLSQPVSSYPLESYTGSLVQYQWEWGTIGGAAANTYKIIWPENADSSVQEAAIALQKAIYLVSGYKLTVLKDNTAQTANEILVGHTNRALSTTLAQNSGWRNNNALDYMFLAQGTKIAIMAGDDEVGTESAVEAFAASYLTVANAQTLNWNHSYQLPGLHDFTIGGVPAGNFQIVVDANADFDTHYNAIRFHNFLLSYTGYNVPVVTSQATKIANEILFGEVSGRPLSSTAGMNEEDWKMKLDSGSLVLNAPNYYGVTVALRQLVNTIQNAGDACNLTGATIAQGTTTSFSSGVNDATPVPVTPTWKSGNTPADVRADLDSLSVRCPEDLGTKADAKYVLAWNDEFDNLWNDPWFDQNKWHFNDSMGSAKWPDVKFSTAQEDGLVKVEDGKLIMKTVEQDDYIRPWATHHAVVTNDTMNYQYGYLEMRGAPPYKGEVEWPSYWAHSGASTLAEQKLGASYNNAKYQIEVDYFEIFASKDTVTPNLHKWIPGRGTSVQLSGIDQGADYSGTRTYKFSSNAVANELHTYGFLWTENLMAFSVDGTFYFSYNLNRDFGNVASGSGMQPFKTQYLQVIFNSTFASRAWSENSANAWFNCKVDIDDATFPYIFTVDYVRYYKVANYGDLLTKNINNLVFPNA